MQLDVRVAPKAVQHQLFSRVAQYKADVASLRHQLVSLMIGEPNYGEIYALLDVHNTLSHWKIHCLIYLSSTATVT